MSGIHFKNEPCSCAAGECAQFVEPDSDCINRLTGDVRTIHCSKQKAYTWHHNGKCLACEYEARKP